MAFTNKHWRR